MWRVTVLVMVLLICGACRKFDPDLARTDFTKQHPAHKVLKISVGEGDGAAVYVHIRYVPEKGTGEREVVWQYMWESERWRLTSRSAFGTLY